jgi:O-antigen ligase
VSASSLLSVARVVVALSTLAALAAHAWLTIGHSWIPYMSVGALVVGAVGGWMWRRGTQAAILALGHVWPLVSYFALGEVDALAMTIWVSAVASLALATSPLARWSLPPRWQIPVAAWGVLIACGWPIILARELDFTLITYFERTLRMGIWAGPARETAAFITGASAGTLSSIVVLDWLWARYGARSDDRFFREVVAPMTVGTTIALGVGIYQGTIDLRWWSVGQWPVLGRATGTFFDSNAFGAVAAIWAAPIAGAAMLAERRTLRVAGLVLLSLAAVGVWASGSRTALLGLLPAFAGIAIALARAGRLSRLTSAIAVLTIVATITVGWVTGGPGSALNRVWQTLPAPSMESVTRFTQAMWVRDGYGAASMAMLREAPLTGVGPGAFPLFAPDYWFRLSGKPIPPDNAQNGWRHQLTELGLVAGLIPIACSLLVLGAMLTALGRRHRPTGTVAAGAMVGTGLMSMVGSPVAHPIVQMTVAILVFWVSKRADGAEGPPKRPHGREGGPWAPFALAIVWLLPIVWAGATTWTAVYTLRPPFRAEAIGWVYTYGLSTAEELEGGRQQRWVAHRAVGVVPNVGTRLVLTFKASPDIVTAGPIHLRVFTRDRVLLDQPLNADESATATVEFASRTKWTMVQIETSRRGPVVDGVEQALQLTSKFE